MFFIKYSRLSLCVNHSKHQLSLMASLILMYAFYPIFGATFSFSSTGNGNEVEGTFEWTPDKLNHPYIMQVSCYDQSILFEVKTSTSIFEQKMQLVKFISNSLTVDSDKSLVNLQCDGVKKYTNSALSFYPLGTSNLK